MEEKHSPHRVTVVRTIYSTVDRPASVVTFDGVTQVSLIDGHLVLTNGSWQVGAFPPGEWRAFYRDEALVSFGDN